MYAWLNISGALYVVFIKKAIVLTETVTGVLNMFYFYLQCLSCHFFVLMTSGSYV